MKSSPSIWRYVVSVKSMVKILSIFVAFLENMNFIKGLAQKWFEINLVHFWLTMRYNASGWLIWVVGGMARAYKSCQAVFLTWLKLN